MDILPKIMAKYVIEMIYKSLGPPDPTQAPTYIWVNCPK